MIEKWQGLKSGKEENTNTKTEDMKMYYKVTTIPGHEHAYCKMVIGYAQNNKDIESIELWSYTTHVATYWNKSIEKHVGKTIEVFGWWSATTAKHISWFIRYIGKAIFQREAYCRAPKAKAIQATVYNPLVLNFNLD